MNTLIQTLQVESGYFGVIDKVLCDRHLQQRDPDSILTMHVSPDRCELCVKEAFESELTYRERQSWLSQVTADFKGAESYNITIYISGPMTGLPDNNRPAFHRMHRMLIHYGYNSINPAHQPQDKPYVWLIRQGIQAVMRAHCLVMLDGWQRSRGARVERSVARMLELPIYTEGK
jgi:hypothetical protein